MAALHWGMWAIVVLLLDRSADVNAKMENGFSVFMHLGMDGSSSDADYNRCAHLLLERKASLDSVRDDGTTALMSASERGRLAICRVILENSPAEIVHACNDDHVNALAFAAKADSASVVELLLSANASVNAQS